MKYVDEFRDPVAGKKIVAGIEALKQAFQLFAFLAQPGDRVRHHLPLNGLRRSDPKGRTGASSPKELRASCDGAASARAVRAA